MKVQNLLFQELKSIGVSIPAGSSESLPSRLGSRLLSEPHMVVRFWVPTLHSLSGTPHSDQRNSSGTVDRSKEKRKTSVVLSPGKKPAIIFEAFGGDF